MKNKVKWKIILLGATTALPHTTKRSEVSKARQLRLIVTLLSGYRLQVKKLLLTVGL